MVANLTLGLAEMLTLYNIIVIIIGVGLGMVFGSIPGLTSTMGVAIALPITFTMDPVSGMALLLSIYIGGVSGSMIPAILLRLPGTPASIATTFDGYPMAKNGQPEKAFGYAIVSSVLGGLISVVLLILIAPLLANVALKFGPMEYFAIMIFALTLVSSLSEGSIVKAFIGGLLGMVLAMIGRAPIDSAARFTFGISDLNAGLQLLAVLIGLFALSEIIKKAEYKINPLDDMIKIDKFKGLGISLKEFLAQKWNFLRSTLIGVGIGILPGVGAASSNIIAYATAKNQSKTPEKFGKGIPDGIVASESANNSSVGGSFIPLMALGIPGETATAMLLGGLILHGIQPGPLFFTDNIDMVYGIFGALIIAHFIMFAFLVFGMRFFIKLLSVPGHILLPIIIVLCTVGAFAENNRVFDMGSLIICGILGYFLLKVRVPITPLILGFILGPLAEVNLRRGLMETKGDFTPFLTSPITLVIWIITASSVVYGIWKGYKRQAIKS